MLHMYLASPGLNLDSQKQLLLQAAGRCLPWAPAYYVSITWCGWHALQGMSLVPAVTELMLAELLYLQYDNPTRPIFMYINSAGVQARAPAPPAVDKSVLATCSTPAGSRLHPGHNKYAHLYVWLCELKAQTRWAVPPASAPYALRPARGLQASALLLAGCCTLSRVCIQKRALRGEWLQCRLLTPVILDVCISRTPRRNPQCWHGAFVLAAALPACTPCY